MDYDKDVNVGIDHEPGMTRKDFSAFNVKSIDEKNRRITAIASTRSVDRHNEIVEPEAFRAAMKEYMRNPVVLATHQHLLGDGGSSVVANVVDYKIRKSGLEVVVEFHCKTKLGREYWELYRGKHQRAFSIGFVPIKWDRQDHEGDRVLVHREIELIEISCVAVGANRDALSKQKQRRRDFVNHKKQGSDEDLDTKAAEYAEVTLGEWPETWGDYEAACVRVVNLMREHSESTRKVACDLLKHVGYIEGDDQNDFVGSFADDVGTESFF
jgi:HK97 family phage prohead protease